MSYQVLLSNIHGKTKPYKANIFNISAQKKIYVKFEKLNASHSRAYHKNMPH